MQERQGSSRSGAVAVLAPLARDGSADAARGARRGTRKLEKDPETIRYNLLKAIKSENNGIMATPLHRKVSLSWGRLYRYLELCENEGLINEGTAESSTSYKLQPHIGYFVTQSGDRFIWDYEGRNGAAWQQ